MSSFVLKVIQSLRWVFLLVAIFSVVKIVDSQDQGTRCGSKLAQTLELICTFGFSPKLKKSVDPEDYYSEAEEDMPFAFEKFPFLGKFQENSLAKTRRRRYGGVSSECCKKPCTMDELRSFCRRNAK